MKMNNFLIKSTTNIRDAIKKMDEGGKGFIFIINENEIVSGILTDGDFRRAVLQGVQLDENISLIANQNFISVAENEPDKGIINIFLKNNIKILPVLSGGKLTKILYRENFYLEGKFVLPEKNEEMIVVIMAGGKGTRMAPFTNILPKPLIPIGEQSMLEVIMDIYSLFFSAKFIISVNYKANLIKSYLEEFKNKYHFTYLDETTPLGTAGCLRYLLNKVDTTFFVSNCDIVIRDDYSNILYFHRKGNYDITIVASMHHHTVPYGVCTIKNGGELKEIIEKPEYDFLVNTGMYILEPKVMELIPENKFYHITHLIEDVKKNGGTVGVFPVTEKSYVDVGQWKEYQNTINGQFLNSPNNK